MRARAKSKTPSSRARSACSCRSRWPFQAGLPRLSSRSSRSQRRQAAARPLACARCPARLVEKTQGSPSRPEHRRGMALISGVELQTKIESLRHNQKSNFQCFMHADHTTDRSLLLESDMKVMTFLLPPCAGALLRSGLFCPRQLHVNTSLDTHPVSCWEQFKIGSAGPPTKDKSVGH